MRKSFILFVHCMYVSFSYAQSVGIGTSTPGSGLELKGPGLRSQQRITDSVSGNSLVLQGGAGGNLKVTGYNYTNFTAQPLYLSVDGANTLINPNSGNVGIGTTIPATRLTVNAAQYGIEHTDGVRSFSTFLNTSGVWLGAKSNHPLHFYTNDGSQQMTLTQAGQLGIGTTTPLAGYKLDVAGPVRIQGNTTQDVGGYGLPKAMVYLNSNGTIGRCYNGVTGATSNGCGFTSVRLGSGDYRISFPFNISARFFAVSAEDACCSRPVSITHKVFGTSELNIGVLAKEHGVINSQAADLPVMVIVY